MSEVTSLGYVVISAADLDAWSEFGQQALGLQLSAASDHDTLLFRNDERSWRLAVERGEDLGVSALGFEVGDPGDLAVLGARLEAAGFSVKPAPEIAAQRQVTALIQTVDPSGVPLEFFAGAKIDKANFVSPRGAQFVTGEQGAGHAVLNAADVGETYSFYVDVLGFRVTDTVRIGPMSLTFTSPNARHHSLAFGPSHGGPATLLHHLMFEVDSIDAVGRALDHCLDGGAPVLATLGRHVNDHMISFYCQSPSGLPIEYGWGARVIDGGTHVYTQYDAASYWGHRPPDGRNLERELREQLEREASAAH